MSCEGGFAPHTLASASYSTTEDLLRREQRLFGGNLISATSLAGMTTPYGDKPKRRYWLAPAD